MQKQILKWPLIVAAVVVVLRIVTERVGVPNSVNNLLSVVALHTLIAPIYFAIRIVGSGIQRPYIAQIKLVLTYVLLTRLMILPVYWLARIFEWPESRFAGLWGPQSTPLMGFVVIPLGTAAFWIVASLVCGTILGTIIIAIGRRLYTGSTSANPTMG
jgi:hypothetical protein